MHRIDQLIIIIPLSKKKMLRIPVVLTENRDDYILTIMIFSVFMSRHQMRLYICLRTYEYNDMQNWWYGRYANSILIRRKKKCIYTSFFASCHESKSGNVPRHSNQMIRLKCQKKSNVTICNRVCLFKLKPLNKQWQRQADGTRKKNRCCSFGSWILTALWESSLSLCKNNAIAQRTNDKRKWQK